MTYSTIFKISSFIPIINLVALLVLILHAYFLYGRMPVYGSPDPKDLNFTYELFLISGLLLLYSPFYFSYLIVMVVYEKKTNKIILFRNIIIYLTGFILLLIICRSKAYNLGEWIVD